MSKPTILSAEYIKDGEYASIPVVSVDAEHGHSHEEKKVFCGKQPKIITMLVLVLW